MGCLTVCRWCCCCFVATINVLTTILGIAFFVMGCFTIWGYWVVRQLIDAEMAKVAKAVEESGVDTNVDLESIHKAIETLFASTAAVFLVLGALLIIISCLGCCGACFGVPACLIIYAIVVGLVFLAQAIVVVLWFTNSSVFKDCSRNFLKDKVINYKGMQNMDTSTLQMDALQISLGCCGIDNGDDFIMATKWNRTQKFKKEGTEDEWKYVNMTYPFSCCKFDADNKPVSTKCFTGNASAEYSNYKIGCNEKLKNIIDTQVKPNNFFYSLAGSLGFDILLIVGAVIIFVHKRQENADVPHGGVQYKMQPQMA